jgi:gluconate 2-dehydrogenase
MSKPTVLVTRRVYAEAIARLQEHCEVIYHESDTIFSKEELRERLAAVDAAMVMGTDVIDAHVLEGASRLKVVATVSAGYNNLNLDDISQAGVMATNTPDVLTDTTADLAFTLVLAAARRVAEGERFLRAGLWKGFSITQAAVFGAEVHHSTLGIVGMGRIGSAVARRARGFDMKVLYHNRRRLEETEEQALGVHYRAALADLLREADHVVLLLPYSAASHHIIGADQLRLMKPTATLVNVGRGGLVDDAALAEALLAGTIGAAGLDVYENEPQVHPALLAAPNTVLLPHVGSATVRTRRDMVDLAVSNVLEALAGRTPPCLLNPRV